VLSQALIILCFFQISAINSISRIVNVGLVGV